MYENKTTEELRSALAELQEQFSEFKARGLALNMARGKPGPDQLSLSEPMLSLITTADECISRDGTDCRNYGVLEGLEEARELMAGLLDDDPANVIVGGNASLTMMYDVISWFYDFGTLGSDPWSKLEAPKWLCPVPGYDRHFAITEHFGFEMIPIPTDETGPDMGLVEELAGSDSQIKGIWCVPQYSNPAGTTYSDETVRALASMKCAAEDFRIIWDNAYAVHHLNDDPKMQDHVLDIADACRAAGNPDRYVKFASTSKVTMPGAGIAALAASPAQVADLKSHLTISTINGDKLNQLRHVRFLHDASGVAQHMAKHAAILRPKFDLVDRKLTESLTDLEDCSWSKPKGGYFVSFDAPEGCAKRIVSLAKEAGVTMTGAGATWPYGNDPHDRNIRIAPTLPPLEELASALDVFVCCVKLAYVEKLQAQ